MSATTSNYPESFSATRNVSFPDTSKQPSRAPSNAGSAPASSAGSGSGRRGSSNQDSARSTASKSRRISSEAELNSSRAHPVEPAAFATTNYSVSSIGGEPDLALGTRYILLLPFPCTYLRVMPIDEQDSSAYLRRQVGISQKFRVPSRRASTKQRSDQHVGAGVRFIPICSFTFAWCTILSSMQKVVPHMMQQLSEGN